MPRGGAAPTLPAVSASEAERVAARAEDRRPARAGVADLFLARLARLEGAVGVELARPARAGSALGALLLDVAREAWGLAGGASAPDGGAREREEPASDEFGVEGRAARRLRQWVQPIADLWLGLEIHAAPRPPERGGVLVACSRSAWPLPVEALVVHAALAERFAAGRPAYVLWAGGAGDWPWVADEARRLGLLAATADNARALLERGAFVTAFPEGDAALAKTYDRRYRLARFADAGLLAAAIEAGAAIVPAALVGNEESYPLLARPGGWPLTLQFPLAGLFGLAPLPLAWSLRLGGEVTYPRLEGERELLPVAEAVADAVRERMQALLAAGLAARRSLVYG